MLGMDHLCSGHVSAMRGKEREGMWALGQATGPRGGRCVARRGKQHKRGVLLKM